MDKEDARFQSLEQLHERRKQVVRLHRQGMGVMRIVELSGLSYPTVRAAIDRFVDGGLSANKPKPRGKQSGSGRSLSDAQEIAIQRIIIDKRPEQLKMDFALWTRSAVMQLIERELGITLSVRGVGNYLQRWGFTPQKPIKKAYEQRPEAVQTWPRAQRFTGVTRPRWSTPTCAVAVMRQRARRRWLTRWAARARSCR